MDNTDNPLPEIQYLVVINDEGRYSIWPDYQDMPWGWRAEGFSGERQACLDHIEKVWTDMRPISLRQAMDAAGQA